MWGDPQRAPIAQLVRAWCLYLCIKTQFFLRKARQGREFKPPLGHFSYIL